jgi:hypothetical protein
MVMVRNLFTVENALDFKWYSAYIALVMCCFGIDMMKLLNVFTVEKAFILYCY